MSKRAQDTPRRHRFTPLVHFTYGAAVVACLVWVVLLFLALNRWAAGAFALCNLLPLVAYVIDVWNTNKEGR